MSFSDQFNQLMDNVGDALHVVGKGVELTGYLALGGVLSVIGTGALSALIGMPADMGTHIAHTNFGSDPAVAIAGGVLGGIFGTAAAIGTMNLARAMKTSAPPDLAEKVILATPLVLGPIVTGIAIAGHMGVIPGMR